MVQLTQSPNTKHSAPPRSLPTELDRVDDHGQTEENAKGNACTQTGNIAIVGRVAGFFRLAAYQQILLVLLVELIFHSGIHGGIHDEEWRLRREPCGVYIREIEPTSSKSDGQPYTNAGGRVGRMRNG